MLIITLIQNNTVAKMEAKFENVQMNSKKVS